ncbi:MAG: hypothetical protein WB779_06395 [Ignavibacteriaceae bacterium]|jgi:hypothetical protein
MKTLFTLLIIISIVSPSFAQDKGPDSDRRGMGKIEELEKIKLIDVLQMNEETTLKFFARRNEYQRKVKDLISSADTQLGKISDYVKNNGDKNSAEMKKMIAGYLSYGEAIAKEKTNFINSLNDILSYEQISKLLVFEKHFREELRKILFRSRKNH